MSQLCVFLSPNCFVSLPLSGIARRAFPRDKQIASAAACVCMRASVAALARPPARSPPLSSGV